MNLLKLNEEYYPVYWVKNFLNDNEIENIKTHARTLITPVAKGVRHSLVSWVQGTN